MQNNIMIRIAKLYLWIGTRSVLATHGTAPHVHSIHKTQWIYNIVLFLFYSVPYSFYFSLLSRNWFGFTARVDCVEHICHRRHVFFFCHRFDTLLKMCINRREKNCVYSTLKCKIKMHLKLRTWWIGVQIKWDFKTCEAWVRASSNTFQGFVEWKKCSNANSRNHAVIGAYLYGLFRLLYD